MIGAILMALFLLLSYPIRRLIYRPKPRGRSRFRRAVILGLDGLEPTIVEQGIKEGWMPHFAQLSQIGSSQHLGTTCPPLSPVAWSTFATGVNPARHGIFDFVHRDGQMQLKLSMASIQSHGSGRSAKTSYRFGRKARSFWSILGEHGIFSHVLRVPVSWPPERFNGVQLSAMGAPDLRGSQGTYTLFSCQEEPLSNGDLVLWESQHSDYFAVLRLDHVGELNLRLSSQGKLSWPGHSEQLQPGRLTQWRTLPIGKALALGQFLLLSPIGHPPRLYLSALQIHPRHPLWPISSPAYYSQSLAQLHGDFATCGMAEDTGALEDGILTRQQFLEQADQIHQQRRHQFLHMLSRTGKDSATVAVFDGSDRVSHMAFEDEETMRDLYKIMDALVGETLERVSPQDLLIVLSDHGFKKVHACVDLNCWLSQQGLFVKAEDGTIDWTRTKVVFLGLSGLHFNLLGREPQGCLAAEEVEGLTTFLVQEIPKLVDPKTQQPLVAKVFPSRQIYSGPYLEHAPDLVVAFQCGYRSLKQASHGQASQRLLWENPTAWCADHCFHPAQVPGVLYSNQKLRGGAHLRDLAPTMLDCFGVACPEYLEGRSLLEPLGSAP